ncbi:hypothetical protein O9929_12930 [Vibrio lentus]|nr:hypothetical protein [Vibrio lentus]
MILACQAIFIGAVARSSSIGGNGQQVSEFLLGYWLGTISSIGPVMVWCDGLPIGLERGFKC